MPVGPNERVVLMRWFVRAGHGGSEGVRERREAGKSEGRKAVA